jgi:hypothetical protein
MADSLFRGYRSIEDVRKRLEPLVAFQKQHKPDQPYITLAKKDYDLIVRWPRASHAHEIEVTQTGVWFRGLQLTYDGGPGRYQKPQGPQQVDFEEIL